MRVFIFTLLALFFLTNLIAQDFEQYFTEQSLRVDFNLSGNSKEQSVYMIQVKKEALSLTKQYNQIQQDSTLTAEQKIQKQKELFDNEQALGQAKRQIATNEKVWAKNMRTSNQMLMELGKAGKLTKNEMTNLTQRLNAIQKPTKMLGANFEAAKQEIKAF